MRSLDEELASFELLLLDDKEDRGWEFDYRDGSVKIETGQGDLFMDFRKGESKKDAIDAQLHFPATKVPEVDDEAMKDCDWAIKHVLQCGMQDDDDVERSAEVRYHRNMEEILSHGPQWLNSMAIPAIQFLLSPISAINSVGLSWLYRHELRLFHGYTYSRKALQVGIRRYERFRTDLRPMRDKLNELDNVYENTIERRGKALKTSLEEYRIATFGRHPLCRKIWLTRSFEYEPEREKEAP
jgi:hypothetical protein